MRPTLYKPEYIDQAYKLCMMGATDDELAFFFEVHRDTISEWKKKHPEFSDTLKKGKNFADAEVAHSLYRKAIGYEHEDVDIKMYEGGIITTRLTKHYPPDTTADIFWLKNRQKKYWRDKQELRFRRIRWKSN